MKTIHTDCIKEEVAKLCIQACCVITSDIKNAFESALKTEKSELGKSVITKLLENAKIAKEKMKPICQDTGMAVVFVELGQDVHIEGGLLEDAINEGIARGYTQGYLRKSMVEEPIFERKNTTTNSPAIIHINLVKGDKLKILVAAKGCGSENKSQLKMLTPADGIEGIKKFFVETVKKAGPNSCPPMVIGVGIGGTMEKAAILAKKAAVRGVNSQNSDPRYAQLEKEFLELANKTGIGPQGLGGNTTAFKVNIEWYPTHIAALPCAININCHASRHAEIEL